MISDEHRTAATKSHRALDKIFVWFQFNRI